MATEILSVLSAQTKKTILSLGFTMQVLHGMRSDQIFNSNNQ